MMMRVAVALAALFAVGGGPVAGPGFREVTFVDHSPLARNGVLIERLFSPFAAIELAKKNDAATLDTFPIDPKDEKFGLYVPPLRPADGYGLLVWVSPIDRAEMPPSWRPVLDQHGVILVMAAQSGNETSPLGRRVPLALTGAANVARRYAVDPRRIWVGGFSGGARIAERMALAYPDVFSGAVLDGSADVIGTADVPLPPRRLFDRFLDHSAIVFTTGFRDDYNTKDARRVMNSLRQHCFDRMAAEVRPREGHYLLGGRSLAKALDVLDRPREATSPKQRQCRSELYAKIDREVARAEDLARRHPAEARTAIRSIDRRYGGLAAPGSLEIRSRIGG